MPTDIKLDQQGGNWLILEGSVVKTTAADLMIDSPARRRPGGGALRRALVHDSQDGLTINFNGDYPGGVTVAGNLVVTGELKVGGKTLAAIIAAGLQSALGPFGSVNDRLQILETSVASLTELINAVIIPPWRTKQEVEEGDDMGGIAIQSAQQLGLIVEYQIDQRNPNFSHEDVISTTPPTGTIVRRGTTVVVTINLEG